MLLAPLCSRKHCPWRPLLHLAQPVLNLFLFPFPCFVHLLHTQQSSSFPSNFFFYILSHFLCQIFPLYRWASCILLVLQSFLWKRFIMKRGAILPHSTPPQALLPVNITYTLLFLLQPVWLNVIKRDPLTMQVIFGIFTLLKSLQRICPNPNLWLTFHDVFNSQCQVRITETVQHHPQG